MLVHKLEIKLVSIISEWDWTQMNWSILCCWTEWKCILVKLFCCTELEMNGSIYIKSKSKSKGVSNT